LLEAEDAPLVALGAEPVQEAARASFIGTIVGCR
jgi:hypothetical protein